MSGTPRTVGGPWFGWKDLDTSSIGPVRATGEDWADSSYIAITAG